MRFQASFSSLSRTLSISNKYFGPLKVRDREREILLYIVFYGDVLNDISGLGSAALQIRFSRNFSFGMFLAASDVNLILIVIVFFFVVSDVVFVYS